MPGAPPPEAGLSARLREALAGRGAGYQPRTHHLQPDGAPKYINRLVLESSPYLLQHAHNPVNWYAWGDDAFEEARRLGRPVFLSVGYSTCHWCHVMEEESFESEEIAAFLNAHYIPVKVDREERPDVDAIYMSAVQALTGSGGWPMSVWLTPDREPFFGGTYFPPHDGARGARFGFLTVLRDIARTYQDDPDRVGRARSSLTEAVKQQMEGLVARSAGETVEPGPQPILTAVDSYKRLFDPTHGGLRRAPKFPSNIPVRLLLRAHRRSGDAEILQIATRTLEKMAGGGIYDQVGGGFHRYSTDERWLVPHFEKMLYDNALLAVAYAEAWQVTRRPDFARVLRETLDYLLREMTSPQGAFYSATDADSEGEEGRFFVWSVDEVKALLGPVAERFMRYYAMSPGGNFEGHNILHAPQPDEVEHAALASARETLYQARAGRVPPLRDDKILAAWNGLAISAFAFGARVLAEPRYLQAAERAADFLLNQMRRGGRILRSWKDGRASQQGFLEDQAFVAAGLLDLHESSFDPRWLREAIALGETLERDFVDAEQGGWFMTASDGERLIAREKPQYDGAEPSGTSVALLNAQRVYSFTADERWRDVAARGLASVWNVLAAQPLALSEALLALDYLTDLPREIAIVLPAGRPEAGMPLLEVVRTAFVPNRALAVAAEDAQLEGAVSFFTGKVAQAGQATAYVCERGRCELPTTDPETFRRQLEQTRPY
jgi:uncharacterized protein